MMLVVGIQTLLVQGPKNILVKRINLEIILIGEMDANEIISKIIRGFHSGMNAMKERKILS